jgi:proline iminopeptidase
MQLAVNGTRLYFDVEGAGLIPDGPTMCQRPVVLALHGGPGFDHAYFKPALSSLSDTAQVIYLDQRGQGRSAQAPIETCTLEQMADDAAALCRVLGIDRPTIFGHSAGGFVALNLALRHPELVGRLVLVDTAAATADMAGATATLQERLGTAARTVAERMFGGDLSEPAIAEFWRLVGPAYVGDPARAAAVADALGRSSFNSEVAGHYFRHRAALYDVRARLGEIRVPTLVVVGELDWLCSPRTARNIAAGIPGAEIRVFPGAGHFPFLEQPEEFAGVIRRYLSAVPVGVGGI